MSFTNVPFTTGTTFENTQHIAMTLFSTVTKKSISFLCLCKDKRYMTYERYMTVFVKCKFLNIQENNRFLSNSFLATRYLFRNI